MRKISDTIIAGLDVGSSSVRLAVGQFVGFDDNDRNTELQVIGAVEVPSHGVHKGIITSIEDVVSAISACLENAERSVGMPIDSAWVGISGLHILMQTSKGVVAVSKADNEITEDDTERAIEASRAIAAPLNYEILHVLPRDFSVDGQGDIKDPVGMTGIRLEVDTQIILGASAQIKNLTKAIYRTGLTIDDVVLGIMATAEAVVTERQKEIGVVVVNIGVATTSLAVFEEGELIHTAVVPVGSEHITNDIAIGLRTSIDIAEAVKLQYADCRASEVSKRDEIDLYEVGAQDHEIIKKQYIAEIAEARVEEIMHLVNQELNKVKRSGLLPAGAVFTGGGAKIPGLIELAKRSLRLPALIGYPLDVVSMTDKMQDTAFAPAVGLVKWGSAMMQDGFVSASGRGKRRINLRSLHQASGQLKKWFKTLIP